MIEKRDSGKTPGRPSNMHDDSTPERPSFLGGGRMIPQSDPGLDVEEITNRKGGNFLLSFGFPGSGKTTFQWMLMNYLMNHGPFHPDIQVRKGVDGPDWEGVRIINQWKKDWITGKLPDSNPSAESDIREVEVRVKTTSGKKLQLDFSFLEVSGELLEMVLPEEGQAPQLSEILEAYLRNPHLKFTLLLMLHPDVEENDELFPTFIKVLDHEFPGIRERMSLGIIVSKPEASIERLNVYGSTDGQRGYRKFDEEALHDYLNRFCGQTYQIMENWPGRTKTLLAPLYIGNTIENGGQDFLNKPDFRHIEQIFHWLFEEFTGKRPGPTLWQRIIGQVEMEAKNEDDFR